MTVSKLVGDHLGIIWGTFRGLLGILLGVFLKYFGGYFKGFLGGKTLTLIPIWGVYYIIYSNPL